MNNTPHMSVDPDGGWSPYLTGALVGAGAFTIAGAIFDDNFKNNWWKWTLGGAAAGVASVWGYGKLTNSRWEKGYATIVDGKKTWHNRGWKTTGYTKAIPARNITLTKDIALGNSPKATPGELATYAAAVGPFNSRSRDAHETKSVDVDVSMGPDNSGALQNRMDVQVQSGNETILSDGFEPGPYGQMIGTPKSVKNVGQRFNIHVRYQHPAVLPNPYFQPQLNVKVRRKVRVKRNHLKPRNGQNGWYEE